MAPPTPIPSIGHTMGVAVLSLSFPSSGKSRRLDQKGQPLCFSRLTGLLSSMLNAGSPGAAAKRHVYGAAPLVVAELPIPHTYTALTRQESFVSNVLSWDTRLTRIVLNWGRVSPPPGRATRAVKRLVGRKPSSESSLSARSSDEPPDLICVVGMTLFPELSRISTSSSLSFRRPAVPLLAVPPSPVSNCNKMFLMGTAEPVGCPPAIQ